MENMTNETKELILKTYFKTEDFYKTVKICNLPKKVVHLVLLQNKVLKIHDKIKYGSKAQRLGGQAEDLFQKLVPKSINANKYWKKNNPAYDFYYEGLTIDVKFSSLRKRGNSFFWDFRPTNCISLIPDLYVIFLESRFGRKIENPLCLVIPSDFVYQAYTVTIPINGNFYTDFIIKIEELGKIIELYSNLKQGKDVDYSFIMKQISIDKLLEECNCLTEEEYESINKEGVVNID